MGSWLQIIPLGRTHQGQSTYYISSQLQPHAASPTLLLVFAHPFQIQLLIETPLKEQLKPKTYFNEPNEPTNASFILQREINKKKKTDFKKNTPFPNSLFYINHRGNNCKIRPTNL